MIDAVIGALALIGIAVTLKVLLGVAAAAYFVGRTEESRRRAEKNAEAARAAERDAATAESNRVEAEYRRSFRTIPRQRPRTE